MINGHWLVLACALLVPAGLAADATPRVLAQESSVYVPPPEEEALSDADRRRGFLEGSEPGHMRSGDLIGAPVVGASGKRVGTISELIIGTRGRLAGVVIEVADAEGKRVGVDARRVQLEPPSRPARTDLTREMLRDAPDYPASGAQDG